MVHYLAVENKVLHKEPSDIKMLLKLDVGNKQSVESYLSSLVNITLVGYAEIMNSFNKNCRN